MSARAPERTPEAADAKEPAGLAAVIDFTQYTADELKQLQDELQKKVDFLQVEVGALESCWNKVQPARGSATGAGAPREPAHAAGASAATDAEAATTEGTAETATAAPGAKGKRRKGANGRDAGELQLTIEQKITLVAREIDSMREAMDGVRQSCARTSDLLKAEVEELDMRCNDCKRELHDFGATVVQGAVHPRTHKLMAEKVQRYLEDDVRHKEAMIEKFRLDNATLKTQRHKLQVQLKQKEEIGEVLHAIDFDQLQIENKQFIAKIEERNAEALSLKRIAARTVQTLNDHKVALGRETARSKTLRGEIAQRRDILAKLASEERLVNADQAVARNEYQTMRALMEEVKVPEVIDYVSLKAKQIDLQKQARSWERKCQIAGVQLQRSQQIVRQALAALPAAAAALVDVPAGLQRNPHNQTMADAATSKLVGSRHQRIFGDRGSLVSAPGVDA